MCARTDLKHIEVGVGGTAWEQLFPVLASSGRPCVLATIVTDVQN